MKLLAGTGVRVAAIATFAALAACAHTADTTQTAAPSGRPNGAVGYVQIDRLVKVHPLYSQLSRLDEDMEALKLKSVAASVNIAPGDLERAQRELQLELQRAARHAQATIKLKQDEIQRRENAAVAAALGAAAPPGGSIAAGISSTLVAQQQRVRADAQKNLDSYRRQLVQQDEAALHSLERSYDARAARQYRARADALQQQEATYALKLADEDKADRLSLRTKLSNLALDDTERTDTRKALAALDAREGDQIAVARNRDQATLAALQVQLHQSEGRDLQAAALRIRTKTIAKIDDHVKTTTQLLAGSQTPALLASGGGPASLPPDMKGRLKTLQTKFQADFTVQAKQTVAEFERTKRDLTTRFQKLAGVDASAQAGAARQLDALQKQRGDLYDQIVAQIEREVKTVAERRGINVVFSDVLAPAGGIDLTADAEKDIESLPQ